MAVVFQASDTGLPLVNRGKVRDVFDLGRSFLIVSTDRISAFDVVMANPIPDKGRVLNQMSNYWFQELADVCPNHLVETRDEAIAPLVPGWGPDLVGRSVVVQKARPLPIECVVRGYITGSLYKDYRSGRSERLGLALPEGLLEGARLPEPVFSPATKAREGHDENISFDDVVHRVGRETAETVRAWSLEIYARAFDRALKAGLILADTKFEFGFTDDGLVWIDEALTPDSSRYWDASLHRPGGPRPSFDKQFVRDYLEQTGWDKRPPGPALPDDVVERTRRKYLEAFERITGRPLDAR
jgi:phosphoribosylaminoimidazole-succinocarboxamide synthase